MLGIELNLEKSLLEIFLFRFVRNNKPFVEMFSNKRMTYRGSRSGLIKGSPAFSRRAISKCASRNAHSRPIGLKFSNKRECKLHTNQGEQT